MSGGAVWLAYACWVVAGLSVAWSSWVTRPRSKVEWKLDDAMFEAMREVDAMNLNGPPMLAGRLPPRGDIVFTQKSPEELAAAYPVRFDRPLRNPSGFCVEYDPATKRIREVR